jgi:hypothetical protein
MWVSVSEDNSEFEKVVGPNQEILKKVLQHFNLTLQSLTYGLSMTFSLTHLTPFLRHKSLCSELYRQRGIACVLRICRT